MATSDAAPPGMAKAGANPSSVGTDAGAADATVLVTGMRFLPDVTRVKAGGSVAWVFNDPGVIHSVTAFDGSFDSGLQSSGVYVVRFDTPGTYCYRCLPHPGENLCDRGAAPASAGMMLVAEPIRGLANLINRGGGHMQGRVIVEP